MNYIQPEVLIENLRKTDKYIETIFLNGGCFQFYKFLKSIFLEAQPYKARVGRNDDYNHIITKINDKYYDIRGRVRLGQFYEIEELTDLEIETFEEWSFSKNNFIGKICPHCAEMILVSDDGNIINIEDSECEFVD